MGGGADQLSDWSDDSALDSQPSRRRQPGATMTEEQREYLLADEQERIRQQLQVRTSCHAQTAPADAKPCPAVMPHVSLTLCCAKGCHDAGAGDVVSLFTWLCVPGRLSMCGVAACARPATTPAAMLLPCRGCPPRSWPLSCRALGTS